jgi:ABC-2 type transport system ATP-binding protein
VVNREGSEDAMNPAIQTFDLSKRYRGVVALDGLALDVPRGSVFGLVGRNGAGKTTTLNLLIGLLRPDTGWARIDGYDAHREGCQARRAVAFVPEEAGVYPWLTVEEAAHYWSRLSGTWNESAFRRCVARFDLPLKRTVARLSKGMRTQLMLALAVGKQPSVYILDEATSGLDPVVRRHVLRYLDDEARREGRTVLLSSHVLSELNETCTHVAVIDGGRLKVQSELQELRRQWRRYEFVCRHPDLDAALRQMGLPDFEKRGDAYVVVVGGDHDQTQARLQRLPIEGLRVSDMQLEDIFFAIIGAARTSEEPEPLTVGGQ